TDRGAGPAGAAAALVGRATGGSGQRPRPTRAPAGAAGGPGRIRTPAGAAGGGRARRAERRERQAPEPDPRNSGGAGGRARRAHRRERQAAGFYGPAKGAGG